MYNLQQKQGEVEWEPESWTWWSGREELKEGGEGERLRGWSFEMCIGGVLELGGEEEGREAHSYRMSTALAVCCPSQVSDWGGPAPPPFFRLRSYWLQPGCWVWYDCRLYVGLAAWLVSPWTEGGWGVEGGRNPVSVFSFPQGKYPHSHLPN